MLKKISCAVIIGVVGTLFFAQFDNWTHKKIVMMCQKIAQETYGGTVSLTIKSVNFFAPSIEFADVEMLPFESDAWQWRCKKCEIHGSWLQLLLRGTMDMHMIVENFDGSSHVHNKKIAIEPHLWAMMQKAVGPIPIITKSLIFKNAHFSFYCPDEKLSASLFFNSSSLRMADLVKTTMSLVNGDVQYKDHSYLEAVNADIPFTTRYEGDKLILNMQVGGTFQLPQMADQGLCYITGVWGAGHGRFSVRNAHNSLSIDPIIITEKEIRTNARLPLFYLLHCVGDTIQRPINGTVHCSVRIGMDESRRVDGQVVVEDVAIDQHSLCDTVKLVFARNNYDWKAKITISRRNEECVGVGYWHEETDQGALEVHNKTALSARNSTYWHIDTNNFSCQLSSQGYDIVGRYKAVVTNILTHATHGVHGDFSYNKRIVEATGFIDENEFSVQAQLLPEFQMQHCFYKDKEKKQLINVISVANDKNYLEGSVSFSFMRSLMNSLWQYDLQGEGALFVKGAMFSDRIVADVKLDQATIRLPQTYNFIDGLSAQVRYDFNNRTLSCENIDLSLHTGKVNCSAATAIFDHNGKMIFAHAPFLLNRCLLNIKKDLFAIVSGDLLFSQTIKNNPCVSGHIIIDRAQLKENLLSEVIQKQLFGSTNSLSVLSHFPVTCDLVIETKSPIKVDTALLQTNAHVNVRVSKNIQEPSVSGVITLQGGSLVFPYKPLYIRGGTITFFPDQLFDPTIELVARNKIKKYDVALQVSGSLLTHHIMLDSTPPLSEEQIVALLLVGSEESSLNSMMPALIVQNVKNLIFTNNQSKFLEKYFKPLLRTFNISLVPSFTDQTGRGGLRGALEISVNDRWRAVIQQNFTLTEDTRFELEFLLSDDIALRAIRDERRDLGGEVEMRWKF